MSTLCFHNRPTSPGLYWMEIPLNRPTPWNTAEQLNEATVEALYNAGLILGAFRTKGTNQPLFGPSFLEALKRNQFVVGENCEFIPGAAYPWGYTQQNTVTKIGYYAFVLKEQQFPQGATLPIKQTCFDKRTKKILYEVDSAGNTFQATPAGS